MLKLVHLRKQQQTHPSIRSLRLYHNHVNISVAANTTSSISKIALPLGIDFSMFAAAITMHKIETAKLMVKSSSKTTVDRIRTCSLNGCNSEKAL